MEVVALIMSVACICLSLFAINAAKSSSELACLTSEDLTSLKGAILKLCEAQAVANNSTMQFFEDTMQRLTILEQNQAATFFQPKKGES